MRESRYPARASSQFISQLKQSPLTPTINGLYDAECIRTSVSHDRPYKTIAHIEYATALGRLVQQPKAAHDPGEASNP